MASAQELTEWLSDALQKLWTNDAELFDIEVGERTIVGLLFHYLKEIEPDGDFSWDVEYNRSLNLPKIYNSAEDVKRRFIPDLIFHERNTNTNNIYAVEVKCDRDKPIVRLKSDFIKLRTITHDKKYKYKYGLSVIIKKDHALLFWFSKLSISHDKEKFASIIRKKENGSHQRGGDTEASTPDKGDEELKAFISREAWIKEYKIKM